MKNSLIKLTLIIILPLCNLYNLLGQQKEVNIDFSSRQKYDSIYAKPTLLNKDTLAIEKSISINALNQATLDSLKKQLTLLHKEVDGQKNIVADMQMNLAKCHKKFKIGNLLLIGGVIAFNIGTSMLQPRQQPTSSALFLILGGLGATVTGIVFKIDSHKYIGKAGNVSKQRARYSNQYY